MSSVAGAGNGAGAGGRTQRVVAKLQASVDRGDYYSALQLCQTLANRKRKTGKIREAIALVHQGTLQLLRVGQAAEASVLANLLVELMVEAKTPVDSDSLSTIRDIALAFPGGKSLVSFLKAAVKWSAKPSRYTHGDPRVNHIAARRCQETGDLPAASQFYLHCRHPKKLAVMLLAWSRLGFKGETDLFLARAVLQLLALENLQDANVVYETFLALAAQSGQPVDTPLTHFLGFLLQCLQREAAPLFKALVAAYEPSLARDEEMKLLVARIGKVFYRIEPPKTGLSAMMGMMEAMLGSGSGKGK